MKKNQALSTTIILSVLSWVFIAGLTDKVFNPFTRVEGRERRAAVAIRDDVSCFQKWGTENFTVPYLEKYYGFVIYLTQSCPGDKKQEFLSAMITAFKRSSEVDLFILAHDNDLVYWMWDLDSELAMNLRLVYNTGCNDISQAPMWLDAGANT
ncbi:hypothetical protein JXA84_06500 [candidate division WOR-3 bacterium]|nr:hypothetical protein [candidate division WOR-3 bacterium]